jgi:hypothetical protein
MNRLERTMFKFLNRIFFEGDAGGGGGAAPVAPAAPTAPAAPAPGAVVPTTAAPAPTSAPVAPATDPFAEYGGAENVKEAVALARALGTPEGVKELFMEAGRAQGLGDDKLNALFKKEVAAGNDPIETLLSDPDKQLTAREVQQLMDARETKLRADIAAEAGSQSHATAMSNAVNSTLTDLKVSDDDREVVLALADKALGIDAAKATPAQAAVAIRKGKEQFEKLVSDKAAAYIKDKAAQRDGLPSPLSGGSASGGTPLPEPKNLAEAKARVRAQFAADQ